MEKSLNRNCICRKGYVTVDGENNGVKATAKIWADVFSPVAHIDISSNKKISAEAIYESWRYQDRVIKGKRELSVIHGNGPLQRIMFIKKIL
jgi:hypothetical protein